MKLNRLCFIALIALLASSCMSYNKLQYVRNVEEIENTNFKNERTSKTIKPFDELYIKVLSTDEKTARIFSAESNIAGQSDMHLVSYTVNEEGYIIFPFVGKILVKDLTLEGASEKVQTALNQYLLQTAVRVRFINNHITVLGEVENEGEFTFTMDKLSIFQAVGMAGGVSPYGDRRRVIVMRIVDNKVTYNNVNLADKNVVESKFYYVEPNDVIIVKPLKAITHTFQNNTYGTALATISSLMAILLFIKSY